MGRRFWQAAAFMLACSIGALAWAQSDADLVAKGESLVRAGRFAEAHQLLAPHEDRLAGDLKFDYLLARSALEIGQPSKASFIYERILAAQPNFLGVRLEMGRAYFALGDFARAKLEFETVLRFENLPPDLRQQAQIYAGAAEQQLAGKRTVFFTYLEYGWGYDSNPQSATRISVITLAGGGTLTLPQTALAQADHYQGLTVGGELVHALTNSLTAFVGGDARGRWYRDLEVADYGTVDGRIGIGYNSGAHNMRVALIGGRFRLDDVDTRDSSGATWDYRYLATKQDQISLGFSGSRNEFLPAALQINDYHLAQGTIGWLRASADGRGAAGLTVLFGKERELAGRVDGDKPFIGARLSLQRSFGGTVGAFLQTGAQRGEYALVNPLFGVKRDETFYDVSAGASWVFAKGWSLRPQVVYTKNKSNLPLFEFDRTDVSLNLRWDG